MVPPRSESKAVDISTAAGQQDGTTVRYLDAGEGPPVVLLHGIGLDAASISWKRAIPALAEDHRVIAPDLPGHGESDKPDIRYTTDYYIDTLSAFLDALGVETVRLAGISMGGCVALGYALDNEVEQLVLVDSYGLGSDAVWRPMAAAALRTPGADRWLWRTMGTNEGSVRDTLSGYVTRASEEFVEEIHDVLQDPENGRTLRRWQRSEFGAFGFRTCYTSRLSDLSTPTLLVHGTDDNLLPVSWSKRAARRLPDSELHLLDECGHWPPRERPAAFNRVLQEFLTS